MASRLVGTTYRRASVTRNEDGHREYKAVFRVEIEPGFGPASALTCPGLPYPGYPWAFTYDRDDWAYCLFTSNVTPVQPDEEDAIQYYDVEMTFSTKNPLRCSAQHIENPLFEPPKISGSFQKYSEEAVLDMNGFPIKNSAHEQLRGPNVEFDTLRLSIKIEQNVAYLNAPAIDYLKDRVNDDTLWGFPARCVKLSGISFEKLYYGTCFPYYKRSLEFETNIRTFDRYVLDEGNKVLRGEWNRTTGQWTLININGSPPNPNNPAHFIRFYDWNGNHCKTLLDGAGKPINPTGTSGILYYSILVQKYPPGNYLALGIPTTI